MASEKSGIADKRRLDPGAWATWRVSSLATLTGWELLPLAPPARCWTSDVTALFGGLLGQTAVATLASRCELGNKHSERRKTTTTHTVHTQYCQAYTYGPHRRTVFRLILCLHPLRNEGPHNQMEHGRDVALGHTRGRRLWHLPSAFRWNVSDV